MTKGLPLLAAMALFVVAGCDGASRGSGAANLPPANPAASTNTPSDAPPPARSTGTPTGAIPGTNPVARSQYAWKAEDNCAKNAARQFPDYTAEGQANRDRALRLCLAENNLPPRTP